LFCRPRWKVLKRRGQIRHVHRAYVRPVCVPEK
jgi:hypothetical protein